MHTVGKIFAWTTALLALVAVYFIGRGLYTQTNWTRSVGEVVDKVEDTEERLAAAEANVAARRASFERSNTNWGDLTVITPDRVQVAPNGRLRVQAGSTANFAGRGAQVNRAIVHAFAVDQDGSARYIGPFGLVAQNEGQSELAPAFTQKPNEVRTWNPGSAWRFRTVVPASLYGQFVGLDGEVATQIEALRTQREIMGLQEATIAQADVSIEGRRKELFGDPQAPDLEPAPELRDGLVGTLVDVQADRDAALAELDRLRRAVKNAYERLTTLLAENRAAAEALPGPAAEQTAADPAASGG